MVKVICTDKEGQYRELEEGIFTSTRISAPRENKLDKNPRLQSLPVVTIDSDKKYQEVLGFGGAFTDAACYMLDKLDKAAKEEILNEMFSPEQMGFNVGRTTVAQCDFGRVCYSYNDTEDDIEMKNFSIDYDRKYIIPVIQKAAQINPDMFLLSSTWSPPGWMKTGGLMTGGWMRKSYLEAYANYYLHYLLEYKKAGININALTPQNETETDQLSLMPACYWHPEFEASFVRDYMEPLLKKHNLDVEMWIVDHNYVMWKRAKWMLEDPGVRKTVKGVAFHPYEGSPEVMTQLHELYPEIDMHSTEIGMLNEDFLINWCQWGTLFTGIMRNWAKSIMCWNIALNEKGKPHIGPFLNGAGMLEINSKTNEITRSAQYFALGHFSKFIKRGARVVSSEGSFKDLSHVAFLNPDGEYVVVVTNNGAETDLSLSIGERVTQINIPENSICTLTFR